MTQDVSETLRVDCCIAGGGPAGMMLGLLLARAGVRVVVLEKHADFLRDFRGDTIHPSTLELMSELGLLEAFLARPHQKVTTAGARINGHTYAIADFSHLPVHAPYIAFMPQWEFLDFVEEAGGRFPGFEVRKRTEAVGLIEDGGTVTGVRARTPDGELEVRAALVVAADGRHSRLRELSGLQRVQTGAPIDVLWLRLPRRATDPAQALGIIAPGRFFIMLDRGDYWQCAYVIPKDGFAHVQQRGLDAFREDLVALAPHVVDRVDCIASWDDVKLLTVAVDHLPRWHRPGLLCIGDAAHAMSPVGGVGINLAIQDAVATANLLAEPLRRGAVAEAELARVQRRRLPPTRITQRAQVMVQNRVISPLLQASGPLEVPRMLRLMDRYPMLRRLPARFIGMGVRPEHVRSPEA